MKSLGGHVLERIIDNCLVRCIDVDERPVIFVWQGNSDEIIEAAIEEFEKQNRNQPEINMNDTTWTTDIGWAVSNLRNGNAVRRPGWHNKTGFLKLQTPDEHSKMTEPYVYMEYPSRGPEIPIGAPAYRIPWLCSQSDLLACDWETVTP